MNTKIPVKQLDSDAKPSKSGGKKNSGDNQLKRIYVRAARGVFAKFRRYFGLLFVTMFAIGPWIRYDGQQAILFDLGAQRFHIFSMTLWPQDLTILAYIFIIAAFALFFVTTFAGRVWCGFMCPQTVWTLTFIWFEEKIEGSRNKRIKLDQRKMDRDKLIRKILKHFCWMSVALVTSLTFVAYFIPSHSLVIDFISFDLGFWPFFWVAFFTFCTYGNAGYMREIMCTHMCPYARFQSAMFDKDTYTVAYDASRGENRGPRSKKMTLEQRQDKNLGDCVDCNLCVQVCPTGIDIRDGLQYECINCGACIDACNDVMNKMGYDKGLIKISSEHKLSGGKTHIVRPKLLAYAVVLLLMLGALTWDIATRVPFEIDIIRDRNSLDRETNDGLIENVYTLKILNKSQQTRTYNIDVLGLVEARFYGEKQVTVEAGGVYTLPLSIAVDPYSLEAGTHSIYFYVTTSDASDEIIEVKEPTTFIYTGV